MTDNDSIQKYVQQFIQENQKTYTRDAITNKLVEAGYSINDVDDAYDALGLGWGVKGESDYQAKPISGDWRNASADPVGFVIFFPCIPILGYILLMFVQTIGAILLIYGTVFLLGTFLPMAAKSSNPSLAKGMIYGFRTLLVLFLCLPVVGIAVLWGICMVSGGY